MLAFGFGGLFFATMVLAIHAPPYFGGHIAWLLIAAVWMLLAAIIVAIVNEWRRERS